MTLRRRLSPKQRKAMYEAERDKAIDLGRGEFPVCNICLFSIIGGQRWHQSHNPHLPRALGGLVTGIAHERCNLRHAREHDVPLIAKQRRIREKFLDQRRTLQPLPGGRNDRLKRTISRGTVLRETGERLEAGTMTARGTISAAGLVSIDDAIAALPCQKSARWLKEFLRKTKVDPLGRPLYRLAGRDKLVYLDRLIEALPCPSNSKRPVRARRRTGTSGGATSESQWTEARALLRNESPNAYGANGSQTSNVVNIESHAKSRSP